jgi:hypothetical protein
MSGPPRDREEFWIRFVCAFLCFGFLAALLTFRLIDNVGIPAGLGIWLMAVLSLSLYVAKYGDEAWVRLTRLLFFLK